MKEVYNKIDLNVARADYGSPNYKFGRMYPPYPNRSLAYSHAYVVSNEDLRYTTALTRDMGRKVLTVAGSGDQPLFYKLNGASHIDTFDVSFCAKAIMDIKTAAIRAGMGYDSYKQMLRNLHQAPSVSQVKKIPELLEKIPADSADFVRGMDGYLIFGNGVNPDIYATKMLSDIEYAWLQNQLDKSFNFIWSDVANLYLYLTDEYDVINLSNIFEWSPNIMAPTLQNLRNHVRPGGYILAQTGSSLALHYNMPLYIKVQEQFKDWAKMGMCKKNRDSNVVVLQRVR